MTKTDTLENFSQLTEKLKSRSPDPKKTWAIATSPQECRMLTVNANGELKDHAGNTISPDSFFEVVAFCNDWQVTFVRNGEGADSELITEAPECDKIDRQVLVWGRVTDILENGWCRVSDARVGRFHVPVLQDVDEGDQLVLKTREQLKEDEFGNIVVGFQRLVGICKYQQEAPNDK